MPDYTGELSEIAHKTGTNTARQTHTTTLINETPSAMTPTFLLRLRLKPANRDRRRAAPKLLVISGRRRPLARPKILIVA